MEMMGMTSGDVPTPSSNSWRRILPPLLPALSATTALVLLISVGWLLGFGASWYLPAVPLLMVWLFAGTLIGLTVRSILTRRLLIALLAVTTTLVALYKLNEQSLLGWLQWPPLLTPAYSWGLLFVPPVIGGIYLANIALSGRVRRTGYILSWVAFMALIGMPFHIGMMDGLETYRAHADFGQAPESAEAYIRAEVQWTIFYLAVTLLLLFLPLFLGRARLALNNRNKRFVSA